MHFEGLTFYEAQEKHQWKNAFLPKLAIMLKIPCVTDIFPGTWIKLYKQLGSGSALKVAFTFKVFGVQSCLIGAY